MWLTHRIRQQAGSYGLVSGHTLSINANPVGDVRGYEGMGRTRTNAVCQSQLIRLTHRIREQARSHRISVIPKAS